MRDLVAALRQVHEDTCSLHCPSVWKTDEGMPPHSERCQNTKNAIDQIEQMLGHANEYLPMLEKAGEDVLQAIDYATLLKKPRWVREWLLGSDDRHPEHAAIGRLRALIRSTRAAERV